MIDIFLGIQLRDIWRRECRVWDLNFYFRPIEALSNEVRNPLVVGPQENETLQERLKQARASTGRDTVSTALLLWIFRRPWKLFSVSCKQRRTMCQLDG